MSTRRAAALRAASLLTPETPTTRSSRQPSPPPQIGPSAPPLALSTADSDQCTPELFELRRNWKWAVVSQWLITFFALINMEDITVVVVEEDLIYSRLFALPRIMHRLLVTLSQDRKLTLDNWQTGLRKQYFRRGVEGCPLGPEPRRPTPSPSPELEEEGEKDTEPEKVGRASSNALVGAGSADQDIEMADKEAPENKDDCPKDLSPDGTTPPAEGASGTKDHEGLPAEAAGLKDHQADSRDYADLSMNEKLDALYQVIEWLFAMPLRLRQAMRNDDENAAWRMEPIGFDGNHNSYWFLGGDRLWINRQPPKPPRKSHKRKAPPKKSAPKRPAPVESGDDEDEPPVRVAKRAKTSGTPERRSRSARGAPSGSGRATRSSPTKKTAEASTDGGRGTTRAAKVQANVKLDQQAKELAALQREARSSGRPTRLSNAGVNGIAAAKSIPAGTRVSARLRGAVGKDDEEWQAVPEEWLMGEEEAPRRRGRSAVKGKGKEENRDVIMEETHDDEEDDEGEVDMEGALLVGSLMDDELSELTELTDQEDEDEDDEDHTSKTKTKATKGARRVTKGIKVEQEDGMETPLQNLEEEEQTPFVEWECIAVTLDEWENIATPFATSKNYLEKSLYKVLTTDVVPFVIGVLKEAEKQRRVEEAMQSRKRSSRIAVKESEKLEMVIAAKRKAEEDERLSRERRAEARAKREEITRLKREADREQRRREREERELRRQRVPTPTPELEPLVDVVAEEPSGVGATRKVAKGEKKARTKATKASETTTRKSNGKKNGTRTPAGDDWELDCEICSSKGVNRDGHLALVCCSKCSKWQHIQCHERADHTAGRPGRNWDKEDFICQRCPQRKPKASTIRKNPAQQPLYTTAPTSGRGQGVTLLHPGVNGIDARGAYHHQSYYPPQAPRSGVTTYGAEHAKPVLPPIQQLVPNHQQQASLNGYGPSGNAYTQAGGSSPGSSMHGSQYRGHQPAQFQHYQPEQRGFSGAATSYVQHGYPQQHRGANHHPQAQQQYQQSPQYPQQPRQSLPSGHAHYANGSGQYSGYTQETRRSSQSEFSDVRGNPAAYASSHHAPYGGQAGSTSNSHGSAAGNRDWYPPSNSNSPAPGVMYAQPSPLAQAPHPVHGHTQPTQMHVPQPPQHPQYNGGHPSQYNTHSGQVSQPNYSQQYFSHPSQHQPRQQRM